ncbi:Asp23/Gls24 family envelope stress response protein [Microbacterium karelineae]|uniref:Asp23/Gls24 family envelope stress response protein n=1 Tax=Microbacterium karelineae TaxID=2654283 RepID=UPI0012EABA6D|nr:Asp23/Gls24 family envelope stress response protein [Microbacterium karelineae]
MTDEHDTPDIPGLDLEPAALDGHTIEELTDYLEAGRAPRDASIEDSPGCRIALDALERLHGLAPDLIESDASAEPAADDGWVKRILAGIAIDARAGRRIPFGIPDESCDLGITEGAVRGIVRAAEGAVPGALIGRCRLDGDVTAPGEPVRVRVDASVPYGLPIPEMADRLRAEIAERLRRHTDLNVDGVDVTVHDIQLFPSSEEEDR